MLVEQPDLTDSDIRSILFDIVIAGSDTTASTTTAALYLLHQAPNLAWLRRARLEADVENAGDGVAVRHSCCSCARLAALCLQSCCSAYSPIRGSSDPCDAGGLRA